MLYRLKETLFGEKEKLYLRSEFELINFLIRTQLLMLLSDRFECTESQILDQTSNVSDK